jgi:hypothetical protein
VVERLWVVVEDRFSMTSQRLEVCSNKDDESFKGRKGEKVAHVDEEEVVAT